MGVFGLVANLLGIGKEALSRRGKLKELKANQKFEILQAQTISITNKIKNNNSADNSIDNITTQNKRFTIKDDIVTYIFLFPLFIASVLPLFIAFKTDSWMQLNTLLNESYQSLNLLPVWYKYGLALVIVDVLGFRSFARIFIELLKNKIKSNLK